MINLSTNYLGLDIRNPIIIGSSGLTNSVEKIIDLEEAGVGAVVLKSIFEEQILMEAEHHHGQESLDYPEAYDYIKQYSKEKGTNHYLDLIRNAKLSVSIPIIASINCTDNDEWVSFAKKIEEAGADALEINVSMLPSDMDKDGATSEEEYFSIISAVRENIKIPIALKMSNYSAGLANLIKRLSWTKNLDAFVLFNRYYHPDIDLDEMKVALTNPFSSGEENAKTLRWVALLSKQIRIPISATTGIHNSESVIKQLLAGAQTVQIVSTVYKNGNKIILQILEEIDQWMTKKGYSSIDDFRGKLAFDNTKKTLSYERVQFMKYYAGFDA